MQWQVHTGTGTDGSPAAGSQTGRRSGDGFLQPAIPVLWRRPWSRAQQAEHRVQASTAPRLLLMCLFDRQRSEIRCRRLRVTWLHSES